MLLLGFSLRLCRARGGWSFRQLSRSATVAHEIRVVHSCSPSDSSSAHPAPCATIPTVPPPHPPILADRAVCTSTASLKPRVHSSIRQDGGASGRHPRHCSAGAGWALDLSLRLHSRASDILQVPSWPNATADETTRPNPSILPLLPPGSPETPTARHCLFLFFYAARAVVQLGLDFHARAAAFPQLKLNAYLRHRPDSSCIRKRRNIPMYVARL